MSSATGERFRIELLKLLLHVAWSDEEIDPREARLILGVGQRWNIPPLVLTMLENCLTAGQPLPAPDLGLLRSRANEVLEAVHLLITSDQQIHLSEKEMLEQIRELLGVTGARGGS